MNKENLKIFLLIIRKFKDAQIASQAAQLSFYTILNIVPLLFVSFFIFKRMPVFDKYSQGVHDFLLGALVPNYQNHMASYLNDFLQNSYKLGLLGTCFVLCGVLLLFQSYESIVCKLTGCAKRSFFRALSTYWTLFTLLPIGLFVSSFAGNYLNSILPFNFLLIFPYLIIWMLFYVAFSISINKPMHFRISVLSSFFSSLLWYFSKTFFIFYIANNKLYANIYGSFSLLLFFFIWVYLSWLIFLFGLKLTSLLQELFLASMQEEPKKAIRTKTASKTASSKPASAKAASTKTTSAKPASTKTTSAKPASTKASKELP